MNTIKCFVSIDANVRTVTYPNNFFFFFAKIPKQLLDMNMNGDIIMPFCYLATKKNHSRRDYIQYKKNKF